ncbi:MAG: hypothetical protein OEZ39_19065 [Gammaproteobacteria bacterium]|nr:hypothetical protein [Gammaproteobacteria bacterium]MDH5653966.1 hypothetical protein [Gammaproteobacteria bacterium]
MGKRFSRIKEILRVRKRLERESYPRLQMLFLVTLTGAAGFFASFVMLKLGLTEMWFRYALAVGIAWLVFLFLLWLWLRTKEEDYADFLEPADPDLFGSLGRSSGGSGGYDGGGGSAGGGGASGGYDAVVADGGVAESPSMLESGPAAEVLGSAGDADELAVPLLVIALLLVILLSGIYVIYTAPVLFAELMVDGVIAAGLYRRIRGLEYRHWLQTALRRTALPFLMTALLAAAIGWGLSAYVPDAHSLGEVLRQSGNMP